MVRDRASGVFRGLDKSALAQLEKDLDAANERVDAFRAHVARARSERADSSFGAYALHEIEAAHEELRVVEEELHAQADEIIASRDALDAERRRYNELFEAAPEAYIVTDRAGNVIEANRRAGVLFNLDPGLLGHKRLISFVAMADRGKLRDLLSSLNEQRAQLELRVQPRGASQPFWVALSAELMTASGQRGAVVRWMLRDIQKDKDAREQRDSVEAGLRERVRNLERTQRLLEQLLECEQSAHKEAVERARQMEHVLGEVAHELRSPLGSIAGWLHLLTTAQPEPGTHLRAFLSMTRSVRSLARLVEDLIEHARFERHAVTLNAATINLVRVLVDVIEDLRPIADLKNVAIGFNAHPYKIEAHADAWRLAQVFRNVIGNAIKFTPDNGVINVNVRVVRRQAIVTVTDTGSGIEPHALPSVFEPFAQALKPGANASGLGLGLSIAKRFVELHGGTIAAESEGTDQGTTIRIVLPLLAPN